MKIANINNIPFEKKLAARCSVLKNGKPFDCAIYKLDDEEKTDYIIEMQRDENWRSGRFLSMVYFDSELYGGTYDLYVMENPDKECLAYAETEDYDGIKTLNLLEVNPVYADRNPKRDIKYIGQCLMAFLAAKSKEENQAVFNVSYPSAEAVDFYRNACGFKRGETKFGLHLKQKDFESLIKNNEQKTGKRIELIG